MELLPVKKASLSDQEIATVGLERRHLTPTTGRLSYAAIPPPLMQGQDQDLPLSDTLSYPLD